MWNSVPIGIHDSPYCLNLRPLRLSAPEPTTLSGDSGWDFASVLGSAKHLVLSGGWELRWVRNAIAPSAEASKCLARIGAVQSNAAFLQSSVFALSAALIVTSASTLSRVSMKGLL
jgi:hypothetical protein